MKLTEIFSGATRIDASPNASGLIKGSSIDNNTQISPAMQPKENSGAATMFATGDMRENCEKRAADAGSVMTFDDTVSANCSPPRPLTFLFSVAKTDANNEENIAIPSTDPADRKNDTDTHTLGVKTMNAMMQSASELSEAERRMATNDVNESTTMNTARSADIGTPAKIKYIKRKTISTTTAIDLLTLRNLRKDSIRAPDTATI